MEKERMKLTKDMFEAGDIHKRLKIQEDLKSKKRRKSSTKYKVLQNEEESIIKRENTSITNEQNNSVIIWSINDNILPKVFNIIFVLSIFISTYEHSPFIFV